MFLESTDPTEPWSDYIQHVVIFCRVHIRQKLYQKFRNASEYTLMCQLLTEANKTKCDTILRQLLNSSRPSGPKIKTSIDWDDHQWDLFKEDLCGDYLLRHTVTVIALLPRPTLYRYSQYLDVPLALDHTIKLSSFLHLASCRNNNHRDAENRALSHIDRHLSNWGSSGSKFCLSHQRAGLAFCKGLLLFSYSQIYTIESAVYESDVQIAI
jgi:hypothetical protein